MSLSDAIGCVASTLVLCTFYARDLQTLRGFAIASNVVFLCYAVPLRLWPIVLLHGALLPINMWRLAALRRPAVPVAAGGFAPEASPNPSGLRLNAGHFIFAIGIAGGLLYAGAVALRHRSPTPLLRDAAAPCAVTATVRSRSPGAMLVSRESPC